MSNLVLKLASLTNPNVEVELGPNSSEIESDSQRDRFGGTVAFELS